jgi:hypothetical protein
MRLKGALIFWTDVVIALLMAGLVATGVIIKWVLPPGLGRGGGGGHGPGLGMGMGRGRGGPGWGIGAGGGGGGGGGGEQATSLLDLTRHGWGDVHFWIAAALVGGVLLHLALHWGWIKSSVLCRLPFVRRRGRGQCCVA